VPCVLEGVFEHGALVVGAERLVVDVDSARQIFVAAHTGHPGSGGHVLPRDGEQKHVAVRVGRLVVSADAQGGQEALPFAGTLVRVARDDHVAKNASVQHLMDRPKLSQRTLGLEHPRAVPSTNIL